MTYFERREERLQQLRAKNDLGHSTCGRQRRFMAEKRRSGESGGSTTRESYGNAGFLWEILGFYGIMFFSMGFWYVFYDKMRDNWT